AEGSVAFFVFGLVVVLLTPKAMYAFPEYLIGGIAAAVGAVVEATSWRIDDNLSIPLSVGVVMWGLYFVLYPSINLFAVSFAR
ncbi:MAG: dolichol kinase, partial [Bacteroidota bacterium]